MSRLGALLLVWLCHLLLTEGQEKVSIAVIGSGIGGSAASYFLREALDDDLHTKIVVFDSATKIGGRTAHYVHDGKVLESGASVIYTGNAYLFNLTERVEGGNARLSEELLGVSASEVRLNTSVARVVGSAKGGYSLYGQGEDTLGTFDAVVIATPIGLAGISLDMRGEDGSPETPIQPLPVVKYQEVHTTFVRGVVDGAYFGLGKGEEVPNSVLLTERAAGLAFSSLALKTWVGDPADGVGVYKLFSRQELWTGMLDSLFVQGSWEILHHREWRAYPVLDPKKAFTRAKLFAGHPVWYVSSLEEGVSAMEVVVIAAKNAALGVAEALRSRNSQPGRVQEANLAADTGSVDAAASAEL